MLRSTLKWMTGFSGMDSSKKEEATTSSQHTVAEAASSDSIEVIEQYFIDMVQYAKN